MFPDATDDKTVRTDDPFSKTVSGEPRIYKPNPGTTDGTDADFSHILGSVEEVFALAADMGLVEAKPPAFVQFIIGSVYLSLATITFLSYSGNQNGL